MEILTGLFQFQMCSDIHIDVIDQKMRYDDCLYITVFDIINAEYHADKKSKNQLAQTAIFVVQRRK